MLHSPYSHFIVIIVLITFKQYRKVYEDLGHAYLFYCFVLGAGHMSFMGGLFPTGKVPEGPNAWVVGQ